MKKWSVHPEIYRLPPSKAYPKGMRVRKSIDADWFQGTPVVHVKDGHHFFTNKELTLEE
jgi:hypothetical protein